MAVLAQACVSGPIGGDSVFGGWGGADFKRQELKQSVGEQYEQTDVSFEHQSMSACLVVMQNKTMNLKWV